MKNFGLSTEFTLLISDRNGRRGSRMQEAVCLEGPDWEAVCLWKSVFRRLETLKLRERERESLERLKAIEDRRSPENRLWKINGELQRRNSTVKLVERSLRLQLAGKGEIRYQWLPKYQQNKFGLITHSV